MGNKLSLLVPGVRSSGNTAKMAWKLGTRKLKKRKPMDYRHTGKRQKAVNKRNALKICSILFLELVCLWTIMLQPTILHIGFDGQNKTTKALGDFPPNWRKLQEVIAEMVLNPTSQLGSPGRVPNLIKSVHREDPIWSSVTHTTPRAQTSPCSKQCSWSPTANNRSW